MPGAGCASRSAHLTKRELIWQDSIKYDYSAKNKVFPDSAKQLGFKPPQYYELGGGVIPGKKGETSPLHHERNPSTISH